MTEFLLQMAMMAGLGGALYVFARTIPRMNDADDGHAKGRFSQKLTERLEMFDEWFLSATEKTLRKVRVLLMKLDNALSEKLRKFKRESVSKETPLSFGEEQREELK